MHWVDYVVMVGMLAISVGIGVYYSLAGDRQRTTSNYLLGNRQMSLLPVMISATVTYVSTQTLIGMPSEIYAFGAQFWVAIIGSGTASALACVVFVPVFYPLKLTSVNEYILMRYESRYVMYMGSIFSLITTILYMGVVLYGPAAAIEAASGFNSWISIVICSGVTMLYTSIGGYKAVIWTDVFQSTIMVVGLIVILVQGVITVGSFEEVMDVNRQWGRLNAFNFNPDPTQRMNFYAVIIGTCLSFLGVYGYTQAGVQRYVSLPTQKKAHLCLLGTVPFGMFLKSLSCSTGLVVFAYYAGYVGCDPKLDGSIRSYNQILPYFVVDLFDNVPGFVGLFLSSCFAASLSTLSSSMNSGSAVIWRDFISHRMPHASEMKATLISKCVVVGMGLMGTVVACIFNIVRGTMLQISVIMGAGIRGPLGVLFYVGLFLPFINNYGMFTGAFCGVSYGIWLATGAFLTDKNWNELPFNTANCTNINDTSTWGTTHSTLETAVTAQSLTGLQKMYSVSWMWHQEMSSVVCIIVAIIVSLATESFRSLAQGQPLQVFSRNNKKIQGYRRLNTVEGRLLHPLARRVYGAKNLKPDNPVDMDKVFHVPVLTVTEDDEKQKMEKDEKLKNSKEVLVTSC